MRPGPIQGDMVHPYLRRRMGLEPVTYPMEELRPVLERTKGVPLFQEQAMKIAIVAAGFTPGRADQLRRAMATFKKVGTIGTFRDEMINGMSTRGYPREFAERVFAQIEGFGTYGFPESHAASFASLVYASAWMKCRYPDVFCAAMLNAQPMGFYAPAQLVRDAREHGVDVRPVDVNASDWDCTLEPTRDAPRIHPRHVRMAHDMRATHAVRLGWRQVKGLREAQMADLVALRRDGYDSIRDVWLRTGFAPSVLETLADADAFASLGLTRRDAIWVVRGLNRAGDKDDLPLLAPLAFAASEPDAHLPPMLLGEEVIEDYRHLTLSLKAHPVSFLRTALARKGIVRNGDLAAKAAINAPPPAASGDNAAPGRDAAGPAGDAPAKDLRTSWDEARALTPGSPRLMTRSVVLPRRALGRVTVSGLVLVRQRPGSAQGVVFMTLEDETGVANIIVWPKVFERLRPIVIGARFLSVTGMLQAESGVIHVVAEKMEDLTAMMGALSRRGTDVQSVARADEVKRPQSPRTKHDPAAARGALPKGRNFQ